MSEIDKKTRADLFRKRIEDKNTLTGVGAIYVGTGKKTEIPGTQMIVTNADGSTGVVTGAYYETVGVAPTAVGQVPVSVSGTGTAGVAGLEFKSATDIFDGTPDPIRMIATGKGTDGNVRIVSNNDIMISALHDLTIGTDGGTGTSYLSGKLRLENRENTDRTKWPYIEVDSKSVIINGETKTKISNISLDTNLKGPVTGSLYIAPSGSASLDVNGATGIYSSGTEETNLAPIIYNIGQRLDSLGFKELGGDFNSAFEFELKKTYKSESGGSATFTLGTLKIAPQDVMGNYCRAVVKFEPVQIDKVKLTATDYDYTHASNDDQRRLLFYCSTYFLYEPATGKLITDVTGESDFSYNNMNRFNNTVITPAEEIEFSFPFSIDVYSTYAGGDLVLEAASITVHFVLTPPGADGKTRVQMKIHSQNFNAIAQTYRIRIPGEATINPFPIIAYKRKI